MERKRWQSHALAVGVILALVVIAFSDVIGPDRGLFFRDHTFLFRRRLEFFAHSLRHLEWPAINPFEATGVPIESILHAIYTPATLVLLLFDFDTAYDLFAVALYFILGTGIYVFALSLGARPLEATASAAVGMLAGPVLSFENLLMATPSIAYAPWTLWALSNLLKTRRWGWVGVLALAAGFQAQGINPEVLLLDLVGAAALLFHLSTRQRARLLGMAAAAGVLAFAVAALEIVPVLEFLPGTTRGRGFSYDMASMWSLSGAQLVDFFVPAFWSAPENPIVQIPAVVGDLGFPYLLSLYFGTGLALAAVAPLRRASRRGALGLLGIAVLGLLLALGPYGLIHPLLSKLPLFSSGRYPVKYLLITAGALAAMMPIAIRAFEEAPGRLAVPALFIVLGTGIALSVVGSGEFKDWLGTAIREYKELRFEGVPYSAYPEIAVSAMQPRVMHALAFASCVALISIAALRAERFRSAAPALIVAAVALDLASAGPFSIVGAPVEPKGPAEWVLDKIRSPYHRVYSLAPNGYGPPIPHSPGRTFFEEAVISDRMRAEFAAPGVRYTCDPDPDALSNRISANAFALLPQLRTTRARQLLGRFGTAWINTYAPDSEGAVPFDVPGEPPQFLIPLERVRKYVELYGAWRVVDPKNGPEFGHALTDPDTWSTAVVYDPALGTSTSTAGCNPAVEILPETRPDRIAFRTEAGCPTVAVALETFMPRWEAEIDGAPAGLFPAEVGLLATRVPAGGHRVVFRYVAAGPRWVPLSFGALLVAIFLSFRLRRREKVDQLAGRVSS